VAGSTGGPADRGSLPDDLQQTMKLDPVAEAIGHWVDLLAHRGQKAVRNPSPKEVFTWLHE
jgi:hypothetical protein